MRGLSVLHHAADPFSGPTTEAEAVPRLRFEKVYEAEFDFAWRSLRRLGVPPPALEDAAQDLFVVVNRRLNEFEGRSSLRTWIFSIAIRVAKEHARRHARQRLPVDLEPPQVPRPPHELMEQTEAVALLDRLLGLLDEDRRAVFVLAELEQMSVPEIATAIGANVNTVYTRLRAARQRFNQLLSEHRAGQSDAVMREEPKGAYRDG